MSQIAILPRYGHVPAWLFCLLLILAPLPFGAVHARAVSSLEIALFLIVGLTLAIEGAQPAFGALRPVVLLAVVLFVFCLLQLLPLPPAVLAIVSPQTANLYRDTLGETERWLPLSIDPFSSFLSVLRLTSYAGAFYLAAAAPTGGKRGGAICRALVISSGLAAIVAWIHRFLGWDDRLFDLFGSISKPSAARLHWPFVNPDHLASLMNVAWPLALGGSIWPELFGDSGHRAKSLDRLVSLVVLPLSISILIASGSRGAMGSAAIGLLLFFGFWPPSSRTVQRCAAAARMVAVAALAAGFVWVVRTPIAQFPDGRGFQAGVEADPSLSMRLVVARQSLGIFADFPIFGTGLGTWDEIYPRYQAYPVTLSWPHAHSDPVEWLTDIGLLGVAILVIFGVMTLRSALRIHGDDDRRERAILTAALGAVGTHAIGDFALRIPANALAAAALCGLLWRLSTQAQERSELPSDRVLGTLPDRLIAATVLVAFVYAGSWEWRDQLQMDSLAAGKPGHSSTRDWRALDRAAWMETKDGIPSVDLAEQAVLAAPAVAETHRTLAMSYRSIRMREAEIRRMVACTPSVNTYRMDYVRLLLYEGRPAEALRQVEEGLYRNPFVDEYAFLRSDASQPPDPQLLAAAVRGLRRRANESPEADGWLRLLRDNSVRGGWPVRVRSEIEAMNAQGRK